MAPDCLRRQDNETKLRFDLRHRDTVCIPGFSLFDDLLDFPAIRASTNRAAVLRRADTKTIADKPRQKSPQ